MYNSLTYVNSLFRDSASGTWSAWIKRKVRKQTPEAFQERTAGGPTCHNGTPDAVPHFWGSKLCSSENMCVYISNVNRLLLLCSHTHVPPGIAISVVWYSEPMSKNTPIDHSESMHLSFSINTELLPWRVVMISLASRSSRVCPGQFSLTLRIHLTA